MGMFDRDPNFGEKFSTGDRFVLVAAKYDGTMKTVHGDAEVSILTIVSRDEPKKKIDYRALGQGLAEQAKRASSGDFPQVVELQEIPTGNGDKKVKKLAPVLVDPREFLEGNDGPAPVDISSGKKDDSSDLGF